MFLQTPFYLICICKKGHQATVVDGGMEIKGSERESKHLNPIWIIKDSHSIPHYHDYMQIGRTNL